MTTATTRRRAYLVGWGSLLLLGVALAPGCTATGFFSSSDTEPESTADSAPAGSTTGYDQYMPLTEPDLDVINLVNHKVRPMLNIRRPIAHNMQVSPDQTRLAFMGSRTMYVANIDGSHLHAVAEADYDSAPSWSPDGRTLLFNRNGDAFTLALGPGRLTRVITGRDRGRGRVVRPSFTPDGQQILFTRNSSGTFSIWSTPVSGGRRTLLIEDAAFGVLSPDGTTLAYRRVRYSAGLYGDMSADLWFADADGGDRRSTGTARNQILRVGFDPRHNLWPSWSPDGTQIAFEPLLDAGVLVTNVRTGRVKKVAEGFNPVWLNNQRLIVEN